MDGALTDGEMGCRRLEEEKAATGGLGCASLLVLRLFRQQFVDLLLKERERQCPHHHLDLLDLVARTAPEQQGRGSGDPELLAFGDATLDLLRVFAALQAFLEGFSLSIANLQYRLDWPYPRRRLQEFLDLCDITADGLLVLFEGLDILAQCLDLVHRGRLGRADASTEHQAQELM